MENSLLVVQIVVSVLLIFAIMVQNKGGGFSRAFSAGPKSFTRRGLEKLVFRATFVLTAILLIVSIIQIVA